MSKQAKSVRLYRTRRAYRWAIRVLALVAAGLATLLLAESTGEGASLPGCGGGGEGWLSGCSRVLVSEWSRWLGVPVALGGVVMYVLVFGSALYVGPGRPAKVQRRAWRVLAFAAVACGLSGLWFVLVQALLLEGWCVYCTAVHAIGIVVMGLVLASGHVRRTRGGLYAAAGALPVAALVVGQVFVSPTVTEDAGSPWERGAEVADAGAAAAIVRDSGTGAGRALMLDVQGMAVRMSPAEMPMMGSRDAEHLLVYVFDYACGFCRDMHGMLHTVLERYNDENADPPTLGVVLVPAPKDAVCEQRDDTPLDRQPATCRAARMVIAAVNHAPDRVEELHTRFMTDPLSLAVSTLGQDVGLSPSALREAQSQRHRNAQLRDMLGGTTPQLIIGNVTVKGRPARAHELFTLIEDQLGIAPATPTAVSD